jgi:hypothetical protein
VDHLSLNEADNTSDPPGIKVRAMQGFEGVSYLADGIAKNMTYVSFGDITILGNVLKVHQSGHGPVNRKFTRVWLHEQKFSRVACK